MRASTATQSAGRAEHGVEVELGDLGQVLGERARAGAARSASAAASAGGAPRKPATSRPALPPATSSSASTSVSGAMRNARLADQLGQHAARPERDQRAEDRVLHDAGEQLDAAARPSAARCTGPPIRSRGGPHGRRVAQVERDAAASRSCARPPRPS